MKPIVFVKSNCKPVVAYNCDQCIFYKVEGYTPLSIRMSEACLTVALNGRKPLRKRSAYRQFLLRCQAFNTILEYNITKEYIQGIREYLTVTERKNYDNAVSNHEYPFSYEFYVDDLIMGFLTRKYGLRSAISSYIIAML